MTADVAVLGHDLRLALAPRTRPDRSAVGSLNEANSAARVEVRLGTTPGHDFVELTALVVFERVPGRCDNRFSTARIVYGSGKLDRSQRSRGWRCRARSD